MTDFAFPEIPAGRPLWLVTLADLALLLVGFLVLVQATRHDDPVALARGFRAGFGDTALEAQPGVKPEAMPVAAAGMMNFAAGSATLPGDPDGLVAWAREALRDPRVMLTITGSTDGSARDVDPATGSAAILAADRARSVASALAAPRTIPADRMTITTTTHAGRRAAMVTQAFTGSVPATRR